MSKTTQAAQLVNTTAIIVDSIADLMNVEFWDGRKFLVKGFYSGTPWEFTRLFQANESQARTGHDGWKIVNPNHLSTIGDANWYTSDGDTTDDTGTGCWVRDVGDTVNVDEVGAKGDGSTDDVTPIQIAIDYASNQSPFPIVEFSNKHYICESTLYVGNFTGEHTTFGTLPRDFTLRGKRNIGFVQAKNDNYYSGTLIESITGVQLLKWGESQATNPNQGANIENITFKSSTSGVVAAVKGISAGAVFEKMTVINVNATGGTGNVFEFEGWVGNFRNCNFTGLIGNKANVALALTTSTFAGHITIDNCVIEQSTKGITSEIGAYASIHINESLIQSCDDYGIIIGREAGTGYIGSVSIDKCYFEGNGISDIYMPSVNRVFSITNCFFLMTGVTDSSIKTDLAYSGLIESNFFYKPPSDVYALNNISDDSSYSLGGIKFAHNHIYDDVGNGTDVIHTTRKIIFEQNWKSSGLDWFTPTSNTAGTSIYMGSITTPSISSSGGTLNDVSVNRSNFLIETITINGAHQSTDDTLSDILDVTVDTNHNLRLNNLLPNGRVFRIRNNSSSSFALNVQTPAPSTITTVSVGDTVTLAKITDNDYMVL